MFLSNTLDTPIPTVFEMSMSESLNNGMKPAFDYLLTVLSAQNQRFFQLTPFKDELFTLVKLVMEWHYLGTNGGSFTESFYGLKRMQVGDGGPQDVERFRPLTSRDKLVTLLSFALGPYLANKVSELHRNAVQRDAREEVEAAGTRRAVAESNTAANSVPTSPFTKTVRKLFIKMFPFVVALHGLSKFSLQVLFMFGKSDHYSPSLWLLGQAVVRQTREDLQRLAQQAAVAERTSGRLGFLKRAWNRFLSMLRFGLVGSAVVFKLVEWYYSPNNQAQREKTMSEGSTIPAPPMPPRVLARSQRLIARPHLCPLCGEPRKNPAMSSGGAVFCYTCIHQHVREHQDCPVTGVPCKVLEIRRLFITT